MSQVSTGASGHGPQFDMRTGFPGMGRKTENFLDKSNLHKQNF
jgi:hypothetical protein